MLTVELPCVFLPISQTSYTLTNASPVSHARYNCCGSTAMQLQLPVGCGGIGTDRLHIDRLFMVLNRRSIEERRMSNIMSPELFSLLYDGKVIGVGVWWD